MQKRKTLEDEDAELQDVKRSSRRLDLTATHCPMTFLKAKLALEELQPGEVIELILPPGPAMRDVPRSLKDEGHQIERVVRGETCFHVFVRKGQ